MRVFRVFIDLVALNRQSLLQRIKLLLNSRFGVDVIWNIASLGFLALGGALVNFLIMLVRGNEALGVFNQVFALYLILTQVGVGGVQFAVLQDVSYHQDDLVYCSRSMIAGLLLVTVLSLPIMIIAIGAAPAISDLLRSPAVTDGIYYAMPGLPFFALNKVLLNTLNGLRRMRTYAVMRSLRFILIPLNIILIMLVSRGNAILVLSLTLSELTLFIVLLWVLMRVPLTFAWFPDWQPLVRQHFSFGMRGVLSGLLTGVYSRIDVLILGVFAADATVGIYSFAATLAEGFSQVPIAIRWNVDPLIGERFAKSDLAGIQALAVRVRTRVSYLMVAVSAIAIFSYGILVLIRPALAAGWLVFALIMLGLMISAGFLPFLGIMLQGRRPGWHSGFILTYVLANIGLNLLLIPRLSLYGAALAWGITNAMQGLLLVTLTWHLFGIKLWAHKTPAPVPVDAP